MPRLELLAIAKLSLDSSYALNLGRRISLAALNWITPQIVAVQLDQIEGVAEDAFGVVR
jgi:hypothetical protein